MARKFLKWTSLILALIIVLTLIYGFIQYPKAKKVQHFVSERIIYAPKDKIWDIIADVDNNHKVTSEGIHNVKIIEGEGLGLKRICSDPNGNSWEETCTIWEPGERFKFEVNTQNEDYPLPFKSLSGVWKLDSITEGKTKLTLDFSYEFKNAFIAGLFLGMGEKQAQKDSDYLLDNWQRMAEDIRYNLNLEK